jgi:hypothetical protein
MGLFGRRNAEDLYRGDPPVTTPGRGGAEPVAYRPEAPAPQPRTLSDDQLATAAGRVIAEIDAELQASSYDRSRPLATLLTRLRHRRRLVTAAILAPLGLVVLLIVGSGLAVLVTSR